MFMAGPKTRQALEMLRKEGTARSKDLEALGLSREFIRQLAQQGVIQRVGRGLYSLGGDSPEATVSLAEVCKRVPHGVVCLLSALQFHGIGTQSPFEVWIAIDMKARHPKAVSVPLRVVRFTGAALEEGVEGQEVKGGVVRVTSPAKTVADCFKYRNKIGLDVALEALREGWREKRFSMDELWSFAKVCRVAKVMRPYLEALTS
jgi:predicted transcriptional regulator of viral defense system